jgi:hypothetical protein
LNIFDSDEQENERRIFELMKGYRNPGEEEDMEEEIDYQLAHHEQ